MNVKMTLEDFKKEFKIFCIDPHNPDSKKPGSYARAIEYLCVFLKKEYIDSETITLIKDKEDDIKNKQSDFYSQLKAFLKNRSQRDGKTQESYLENGFIRAAIPYLFEYWETKMISENDDDTKDYSDRNGNAEILPCQKIFFGAPGTGKSFKANAILGKNRKNCFSKSDHPKSNGYANDLCDVKNVGFEVWSIDNIEFLEKKLVSFESDNKVTNPRHSALRAYIDFFKKYREENRENRTTFHPDYDYAQFVGAYKPKKVQNIDDGSLSKEQLAQKLSDVFPNNGDREIDKTTAITLFGLQYANSLKGKNMNEIVRLSEIGEDQYKSAYLSAAVKARLQLSDVDEKITYSFVPQVFAKAYTAAWKLYLEAKGDSRDSIGASPLQNDSGKDIQVYLVIEEINRGNCAQIFGDIFQLLDRDSEGFSQYSIDADCDFAEWLKEDSILKTVWSDYETKVGDGKLKFPPNLNILATMNTSDQSLFPMDSAFKRRFDWEYVPINYEKAEADFIVGDVSFNFKWLDFLKKVNADIYKVTQSEDKQMGEFFIKPKNKDYITLDEFRSKVLFYLWDSVYKDELDSKLVFHFAYPEKGPDVTFQRLFNGDFVEILKKMLANLDNEYKDGAQILISSGANP